MVKFNREVFFPIKDKIINEKITKLLTKDEILYNDIAINFEINDISSLANLRDNSIIFLDKVINLENINSKNIHVVSDIIENKNFYKNITIVKNLSKSYNTLLNNLYYHEDQVGYIDEYNFINGSYISKYCKINHNVEIGKNCVISRGVEIGKNSIIKNNVVIKNALIGNDVIISDNSSVGTSGFGFNLNKRGSSHLNPQIGIVIVEDNVNLGSCCTIDRGKIDYTFIGKNSMIDNLVHIAHNVIIGKNACIAAQTGISGSVEVGENVTVGGQVGFAGHIKIGENVVVAARSGVTKNIKDNSVVAGFPAVDIKEWKKNIIRQRKYGH